MTTYIATAIFLFLISMAALSDVYERKITNKLNVLILFAGLAWRITFLDFWVFAMGLSGFGLGLLLLLVPFAFRWVGAGDVKFTAACGVWLGPIPILFAGVAGIAGGGILAFIMAIRGGFARSVAKNVQMSIMTMSEPQVPNRGKRNMVPLGVPLAISAAVCFLYLGAQ